MKHVLLITVLLTCSTFAQIFIEHPEYKPFFDSANVTGSIFINKLGTDTFICYNKADFDITTLPASTFKICNSLIGLETGVIADENFVIKWDGITRPVEAWNHDLTLAAAIKVSAVPYYQELARRVGAKKMQQWIDKAAYGNRNIGGGIDKFWLTGKMRISPRQQIDFLQKLYKGTLPFSKRNQNIVKHIIINDSTASYILRAKTGWAASWAKTSGVDIGWWVGYVETGNQVYFFATRLKNTENTNPKFAPARIGISREILSRITGLNLIQDRD